MADASGPSGGGYDYVRDSSSPPPNPKEGDEWYQPDENDAKTYNETSGDWEDMKISDHTQLTNVDPASHHDPVTVGAPITRSEQVLALAYGGGLGLDGSDQLAVDTGDGLGIDGSGRVYVAADYATASELTNHSGDVDAHHTRPTSTQVQSVSGGYDNNHQASFSINNDYGSGGTGNDKFGYTKMMDGVRVEVSEPDGRNFEVKWIDVYNEQSNSWERVWTGSRTVDGSDTWEITFTEKQVSEIKARSVGLQDGYVVRPEYTMTGHLVAVPSHNHPI